MRKSGGGRGFKKGKRWESSGGHWESHKEEEKYRVFYKDILHERILEQVTNYNSVNWCQNDDYCCFQSASKNKLNKNCEKTSACKVHLDYISRRSQIKNIRLQ